MSSILQWEVPGPQAAERVFLTIARSHDDLFWLDSGDDGVGFIGSGTPWLPPSPVLPALRRELAAQHLDDTGGFPIGLVGWLDYRLRAETLGISPEAGAGRAAFLRVDRGVVVRPDGSCVLVARGGHWSPELAWWRDRTLAALARAPHARRGTTAGDPVWAHTDDRYLELVEACQRVIRDGDAYVLNLSTEARVTGRFDPMEIYLRLRGATPAHHGGYLSIAGTTLLSASPEQFLAVDTDGRIATHPVKGTVRRPVGAVADALAAQALGADEKERAENLMIVDLMRNDFARVSEFGDVEVPRLFQVETQPHIHQLVSSVTGRLAPGRDVIDLLAACFPAGSMTGAPKRRSVEILAELEQRERGMYAGAFGYFAADGRVDLAMTIRSIVIRGAEARIGVGGGITALSDPRRELEEVALKAGPLLAALRAAS